MRKWGAVFGIILSVTTMIVASSIYPFGIMDSSLAVIVLGLLLYIWYGGERL